MKYRKYMMIAVSAMVLGAFPGTGGMRAMAQEMPPGWNRSQDNWYWADPDGSLHKGWLRAGGRTYYMDENGVMARGWKEVDGDWYYFHQDGGMNQGELVLGNAVYECSKNGAMESARWVDNTGAGAYDAGCYDQETQALFDELNEEKKQLYFDTHPDRENEDTGDMHRVYDRGAGFGMDMALNKAAQHRLEAAMEHGYADGQVYGEGTVNDYLSAIPYRSHATCLELYIRGCQDEGEAWSKAYEKTEGRYGAGGDRKYSLEYYHSLGMAHRVKDGKHYFMIILMR